MASSFKKYNKKLSYQFPILYQNRYCDQEEFSIGVFSDDNHSGDVSTFKPYLLNNFDKVYLPGLSLHKYEYKAVSIGSDIYVLNLLEDYCWLSIEIYSSSTKTSPALPLLKEIIPIYYVSSFMQKVFVISETSFSNPSWYYDTKTDNWTSIASMMGSRERPACTVFEGELVVTGGFVRNCNSNEVNADGKMNLSTKLRKEKLKSIESYDFHENNWYYFPYMLSPRVNHSAVSIGNKMFMIGGSSEYSEVFDSITRKFTYIKTLPGWVRTLKKDIFERYEILYQVVNIGYTIYFFREEYNKVNVHSYDVRNNVFNFKTSMVKEIFSFNKTNCIKVPIS